FGDVEVLKDQTIIAIVGDHMADSKNVLSDLFTSLTEIPIGMVSFGATPNNVSILVASEYKTKALQLLNSGIFGL
ncbi:MAG: ACT domain-containing protein, partial [Sphingobacteriales bacterium]